MAHAKDCVGNGDDLEQFTTLAIQAFILLTLAQLIYVVIRPFGQPRAIAQVLAGFVLGASGLSRFHSFKEFVYPDYSTYYVSGAASVGRMFFMFLIGLEMDINYLRRRGHSAASIVGGGVLASTILAFTFSYLLYWQVHAQGSRLLFTVVMTMLFANTASPILVRMVTELKLATSEVGRLAIHAALISDMACLLLIAMFTTLLKDDGRPMARKIGGSILAFLLILIAAFIIRPVVKLLNRRNKQRKHLLGTEVVCLLVYVVGVASMTEVSGYNSMMACFLIGIVFPKDGITARTLQQKLTYPVHNFVLPFYFGSTGFQADLAILGRGGLAWTAITVVTLSTVAKVGGTLAVSRYLKMSTYEGLVLGFLLNVKGHVALMIIAVGRNHGMFDEFTFLLLIVTVVANTVMASPLVVFIVRRERKALAYKHLGLEWQGPDSELRVMSCVHGPRDMPTMIGLVEASRGAQRSVMTPFLMHLVELTVKTTTNYLYHHQEEGEEDKDYSGEDGHQINMAVDAFTQESGITVRQILAVSAYSNMHEDVCIAAEDLRASIILLPFHKHQRLDGQMESRKKGIRTLNHKVLRHGPCSVGILVDRGLSRTMQASAAEAMQNVAALFFGGPDDREALAYSCRMAEHPGVGLTVIRFLPSSRRDYEKGIEMASSKDNEVLVVLGQHEDETEADEAYISNFYNRYVVSGVVSYIEKFVENGADTVTALSEMEGMFSLYIVGKGGRGLSPLTTGMSDWEECPELGTIGDLLASSDFTLSGSVLVIQQHNRKMKTDFDEESRVS